jgi:lipopolysaccharide transport system ATP-binding protein
MSKSGEFAIQVENLSKMYRLGSISSGTISQDLNIFWHHLRGKENPYLRIGEKNDRTAEGGSDYVWALKDLSFNVKKGDILGVIGSNGAGKSTLLKILSKITAPTSGKITIDGRIASLLEVGTGFHPELTGRENIFLNGAILGMSKVEIKRKLDSIVEFSGCVRYIDTPVKRYSSGMSVRLGFAVAAFLDPEIMVVDEVLAVGDADFQKKCLDRMSELSHAEGRTILFVSHNISAIRALCNNAIVLDRGTLAYNGNVTDSIEYYLNMNRSSGIINPDGDELKLKQVVIGNQDKETNALEYGDTLVVSLHFYSEKEWDKPYFWCGIKSRFGSLIGANGLLDGIKAKKVSGDFTVTFKFPNLKLLPQDYTVSFGSRASDGHTFLMTSMEIGSFSFVTPVQELGMNGPLAEMLAKESAPVLTPYEIWINDNLLATFEPHKR